MRILNSFFPPTMEGEFEKGWDSCCELRYCSIIYYGQFILNLFLDYELILTKAIVYFLNPNYVT